MSFVLANLFYLLLLMVLLGVSGVFSGIETVLFSLSRHDRARMKKSANRMEVLAASLLDNPRALLTSLLVGNMTCNIIVFVVSSMLLSRLEHAVTGGAGGEGGGDSGHWPARAMVAALAIVPPLLVTYMSDVFPKVIGSLNNTRIAPLIALPVTTLVRALWPLSRFIDYAVMRPVHRLVSSRHGRTAFSTAELRELLEMSEAQGVIDVSENELLLEVVRIADLRVRDVMTPRVDLVAYNIKDPPEKLVALFRQSHLAKILVFDEQIDNILGLVYAKTVLLDLGAAPAGAGARRLDIRKFLQPVHYVPEQQTLDRLLMHFRQASSQFAVVVDEYGGLVGVVALEDAVEQMVGDIYEPHDRPAHTLERVGPDEYLVPGDLSMADWIDAFGGHVETTHASTVAGLLAALLKRLPREGDEVKLAHLSMRVESMRGRGGRRVDKVRLKLLDKPQAAPPPGGAA
jgi:putative hemolysin